jgi:hypothetical protein
MTLGGGSTRTAERAVRMGRSRLSCLGSRKRPLIAQGRLASAYYGRKSRSLAHFCSERFALTHPHAHPYEAGGGCRVGCSDPVC